MGLSLSPVYESPGGSSLGRPDVLRSPPSSDSGEIGDWQVADRLNRDFSIQFANDTRDIAKSKGHKKVAALLFSWKKEGDEDCMDTTDEVQKLREVLEGDYNYNIHEAWLSTQEKEGLPKHQLSYFVAKFIKEEDAKDALLIVYYGGHGFKGGEGLRLVPGNPSSSSVSDSNEIVLEDSIIQLKKADADVLLILDCCYADYLTSDEVSKAGFGKEIFEFIASSGKNQVARGPGPHSFTTSLTDSLRDLASEMGDGFTVTTLMNKIHSKELFRDNTQTPVCSEFGNKPSYRRLKIMPLPPVCEPGGTIVGSPFEPGGPARFYLSLQYRFTREPTPHDISRLSSACKDLVKFGDIPIQQVVWAGLSDTNHQVNLVEAAGKKWKYLALGGRRTSKINQMLQPGQSSQLVLGDAAAHGALPAEHPRDKGKLDIMKGRLWYLYRLVKTYYDRTPLTSIFVAFLLGIIVSQRKGVRQKMMRRK